MSKAPILSQESMFTAMLQTSPFSVQQLPPLLSHPFSQETRLWVKKISGDPLQRTKYRAVRNQILDLLNIDTFQEIPALLEQPTNHSKISQRAYRLLGNMFGIKGHEQEIQRYINDYARTADEVIHALRAKALAPYSFHIETTNEIESTRNPIALLLILFNKKYHQKARFEAKRKLVLMNLAGSIDQREREIDVEGNFSNFLDFLNQYIWSPQLQIGDLEVSYLHSQHSEKDFSCTAVSVISEAATKKISLQPREKLTLIKRRFFHFQGSEIPLYVTIRKKPAASKVLKLLRKNEKNPAVAVDDELGLMAVFNSPGDIKRFLRHLPQRAIQADSFMTLEDISDTLTGGYYASRSVGSSSQTPMLKFFARLGGIRVEFIIHTNTSYLNYIYQRGVSHDEYEVKRIFDTGVAEFLFPSDIYQLNMGEIRTRQIHRFRRQTEGNH